MSVIMNFAIFPIDKGEHVSQYVKKVVEMIDALPCKSQLTSMGTIVECDTMEECLSVISKANAILEQDAERIYCTATFDNKRGKKNQMEHKVEVIKSEIN
ncbi:MTH1187 family thiamine-binding protein [uncultured Bacteroides sp.]|uniref:MTH1187 family thiamine-binding protein n=1 Tax=uncultured Bacteroides sp. TaxID=162156 RepID=UPI0037480BE3